MAQARQTERWALLVGIADYLEVDVSLKGPHNDVPRIKKMLLERGFRDDHIRVCMDAAATRQGILDGWHWLQQQAKPGDMVFFYYSGHGTLLPPREGDSTRTARCALVPYDAISTNPSTTQLLLGSEIGAEIDKLATSEVVVMVDACNSGRASRSPCERTRFIAPSRFGLPPEPTPEESRQRLWKPSGFSGKTVEVGSASPSLRQKEVYLGAARTDQTASEDIFLPTRGDARANPYMGAFTYFLLQETERDPEHRLTYAEIVTRVRADLLHRYGREQVRSDKSRQPTQEPQFTGPATARTVFLQPITGDSEPTTSPVKPVAPQPTLALLDAPLRILVQGHLSKAHQDTLKKLPFVHQVTGTEPNDILLEEVPSGARIWRGRVPLEPCAWQNVPTLLARLHAAWILQRLTPSPNAPRVRLSVNNDTYIESTIGQDVTLSVQPEIEGYVTLLDIAADGTLTGQADIPVQSGQILPLQAKLTPPAGIDFAVAFVTREPLGLKTLLPSRHDDQRAGHAQEIAKAIVQHLSTTSLSWGTDSAMIRIRRKNEP